MSTDALLEKIRNSDRLPMLPSVAAEIIGDGQAENLLAQLQETETGGCELHARSQSI